MWCSSGYQYGDKAIQRFSQNHLSGTGCSEFGDLGFMPSADDPKKALERDYHAEFEKENEKASPGYYAVTLACGTKVEATCTRHVSLFRFTFPKGKPASLLFDPYAIHGKGLHNYTEGNAFHWNWHVMQEPNLERDGVPLAHLLPRSRR